MRLSKLILLLPLSLMTASPVVANGEGISWNCRNADFEISCSDGVCTASADHTPMDISVGDEMISWCAYSGCWEGTPSALMRSGRFVSFYGNALENDADPSSTVDVAIVIDTQSGTANIMAVDLFATPATCQAR